MSIATELTALQGDITAARTAITTMGGTVTADGGSSQLARDIATIPSGGIPREVTAQGVYQIPQTDFTFRTPLTATDLGERALQRAFNVVYDGDNSFDGPNSLVSVDLSSLTKISGDSALSQAFPNCRYNLSADFRNVLQITGNYALYSALAGNTRLASVDFSSLVQIGKSSTDTASTTNMGHFSYFLYNSPAITTISFPKLEAIYCSGGQSQFGTFAYNNKIKVYNFPKLSVITKADNYTSTSTAVDHIFYNNTAVEEIHFAATNQAAIEATSGYATKWGAPSDCTIYFDL